MTKLAWGAIGQRFYEAGVDRGVLYIGSAPGVPWNGLKSVKEAPSGGDPKPFYLDGVKYLNLAAAEEYEATINAFSAPPEFDVCDGSQSLYAGLIITQQPRSSFGFSYRSLIGDDISALDSGYKIHLVYNALAGVASRERDTVGLLIDPMDLTWPITTTPPRLSGYRPTAHMMIDSRLTADYTMAALEDIIYGTDLTNPRLPTQEELVALFSNVPELFIIDHNNGTYTAEGTSVTILVDDQFMIVNDNATDNGDGSFTIIY